MEEIIKERIEMYKKKIEELSDQINEEKQEWKERQLIKKYEQYVAIRDELQTLILINGVK